MTQYLVTYGEVGDELLHSLSVDATQLNAIVSNLQPGTEYLFSVSASNAQGEGANATIILRLPASATGERLVKCLQSYTMTATNNHSCFTSPPHQVPHFMSRCGFMCCVVRWGYWWCV